MSKYILPVLAILIICYGVLKKVNIYDSFVVGSKQGAKLAFEVFPYLCAILIVVEMISISGLSKLISQAIAPVFNLFGIPSEIAELVLIRPLSGNGSIGILSNIYSTYGADSYISRCASVVSGCSETIFYITALYFSNSQIKKLRYAIPVSLFSCFIGSVIGCMLCKII